MIVLIRIAIHNRVMHNRGVQHDQQLLIHYLKWLGLKNQRIQLVGLNLGSSHLHLGIATKGMETNKDWYLKIMRGSDVVVKGQNKGTRDSYFIPFCFWGLTLLTAFYKTGRYGHFDSINRFFRTVHDFYNCRWNYS